MKGMNQKKQYYTVIYAKNFMRRTVNVHFIVPIMSHGARSDIDNESGHSPKKLQCECWTLNS